MKRFISVCALLIVAIFFSSCTKDSANSNTGVNTYHFVLKADVPQTKTGFSIQSDNVTYKVGWNQGDKLAVFFNDIVAATTAPEYVFTNTKVDGPTADFEGDASPTSEDGELYSFYPASAFHCGYGDGCVGVSLKSSQEPVDYVSYDPTCDILVASPCDYYAEDQCIVTDDFFFDRKISVVRVNVISSYAEGDEINSLKINAPEGTALTGVSKVNLKSNTYTVTEPVNWVEATYDHTNDKPIVNDEDCGCVYLVVNPISISAGSNVTFSGTTENYTFSKTIQLPRDLTFPKANIAIINLTINEEDCFNSSDDGDILIYSEDFSAVTENKTQLDATNSMATGRGFSKTETVYLYASNNTNVRFNSNGQSAEDPFLNVSFRDNFIISSIALTSFDKAVDLSFKSRHIGTETTVNVAYKEHDSLNWISADCVSLTNAWEDKSLTIPTSGIKLLDIRFEAPAGTLLLDNIVLTSSDADVTSYAVSVDDNIQNGSVAVEVNDVMVTRATPGTVISVVATPHEGYKLGAWDIRDASNNQIDVIDGTFTMPSSNVTVSATFVVDYNLTVAPMNPARKPSAAGSHDFTVTTNTDDWTVSVPNDQTWASVAKNQAGTKFTVTYTANESETETTVERSVVITVSSDQAGLIGEKAIKITLTQGGREYIAPGSGYELVTDVADLSAGMVIVLGCKDKNAVAGQLGLNKYLSSEDATIVDGVLNANNAIEFTLGGTASAWTLTSTEGQLGATAIKSLSATESATNYVGTWTISIADGNATITSTNTSYGSILYNASSPRFTTYASNASGMADIQIYAKNDGLQNRNLAFTANADTKDIKDGTAASVLSLTGVTDGTKTYKSSDVSVATVSNDGVITLLKEGTTTISVDIAKNETYRAGSASYTLSVTDTRSACAAPTANPAAGEVEKDTQVTLSCSTANSTIYYRIGTTGDFSIYSSAIKIDAAKTIQAYAVAEGYKPSAVSEFKYIVSGGTTMAVDFESTAATYSDWTFTNISSNQAVITAHSGGKHGTTDGKATASIQTKNKVNNPKHIVCYVSKSTNNTTSSSWKIQYSTNGTTWIDVKAQSAASMNKGSWVEFATDFDSSLGDVYVRVFYDGTSAVRCIDDLVLSL